MASMGPSSDSRDDFSIGGTARKTPVLQWGPALIAGMIRRGAVEERAAVEASMGPSSDSRDDEPGAGLPPRVRAASMGPSSDSRDDGGEPAVTKVARAASMGPSSDSRDDGGGFAFSW